MISGWLLILVLLVGCQGCDQDVQTGPTDAGESDLGTTDTQTNEDDGGEETICTPGEVVRCREANTPAIDVCNADGTETEAGTCPSGQVCREGACVDVDCIPGERRCASESQPEECNEEGTGFEAVEACADGAICEEGFCLDRCEIAEETNSYIGCEYWGVQLENHLLNDAGDDGQPLPEEETPPYAIVLANTSTTYNARVSVYAGDGEYAEAIPKKTVGTDIQFPGDEFTTVRSELVGTNGEQLQGPIEGEIKDLPLPKQSLMTLILPERSVRFGQSSLEKLAYKVESTQPIVAYQFNPLCCNYSYTNDASLLIPTSALTGNYMFMSYSVWNGSGEVQPDEPYSPTLTVLATEPNTDVTITIPPEEGTNRSFDEMIYGFGVGAERVEGPDENGTITTTLQPFEMLNVAGSGTSPAVDLTGALVEASEKVSVFGGHTCAFVPGSMPACDHLEDQLFPLETWGKRFTAAPLKLRSDTPSSYREGTYWKFLAREDDTKIQTGIDLNTSQEVYNPADFDVTPCYEFSEDPTAGVIELDSGESCEFGTHKAFTVVSNEPIMLGAFLSGQFSANGQSAEWGTHAGDPAFFLVPPEEQHRSSYSFLTPATFFVSYVTVTLQPGFTVRLDGEEIDPMDYDHEILEGQGVMSAHIPVEEGPHTIEADTRFGLVVYGYDDYVSYAYTGGLNLSKLSPW